MILQKFLMGAGAEPLGGPGGCGETNLPADPRNSGAPGGSGYVRIDY